MTEETYEYANDQLHKEKSQIELEILKLEIKKKQCQIKFHELDDAYENGEENDKNN